MAPSTTQKWLALFRHRCPRCCDGSIYTRGEMNQRCPVCRLLFEREPGYFLGAMYISYGMATAILVIFLGIGALLLPNFDLGWIVLMSGAAFVPFVPMVTRFARVIWIFFDRWAWPGEKD